MPKEIKPKTTASRVDPLATPGPSTVRVESVSRRISDIDGKDDHRGDQHIESDEDLDDGYPYCDYDDDSSPASSTCGATPSTSTTPASPGYLLWANLPTKSPPCISRMLRVPASLTFKQLHKVLQVAFGWTNRHVYSFEVHTIANNPPKGEIRFGRDPTHVMSLQMREMTDAMADFDFFRGPEQTMVKAVGDVRLHEVFGEPEWRRLGVTVTCHYDMGDGWEHSIQFAGPAEPHLSTAMGFGDEQRVFCFGGEGHPCCEDCGGSRGFEELKVSSHPLVLQTHCFGAVVC